MKEPLRGGLLGILTLGVSLATFMQILDYSIANVAIPYIAGDIGVSNEEGTYVITAFAVGNAIALPMTGWLVQRFGSVKTLMYSVALFTLLSWFCGISFNLMMLVTGRFLQGFVAGPLIPLSQSILVLNYPVEKRPLGLSLWNAIVVAAPVLGPILGGWITYDYSWPWIFFINIPVGIISLILIWMVLHDRETPTVRKKVDWVGFLLLAFAIGPLQVLLDKGQQFDWFRSPIIRTLLIISCISLIFLIAWELTDDEPLLEFRLFKIPSFSIGTICMSIAYLVLFGAIVLTPLWLQTSMGYTALWAGLAVAPMGVFPFFFCIALPSLMKRYQYRHLVMLSFILFTAVFFYFTLFTVQVSFEWLAYSRFLLGFPILFFFTPLVAMAHRDIPDAKLSSATGMFHFIRIFCGGAGASLFVTLWQRRTVFHHSNIGSLLTPYNPQAQEVIGIFKDVGMEGKQPLEALNEMVDQQSALLAQNDAFWVSAGIFIALTIILAFVRKKKGPKKLLSIPSE